MVVVVGRELVRKEERSVLWETGERSRRVSMVQKQKRRSREEAGVEDSLVDAIQRDGRPSVDEDPSVDGSG